MSWADEAVHAVTPGPTAAAVYLMVAKLEVMRALRVVPGRKGSLSLREVDEPDPEQGTILAEGLAVGARDAEGGRRLVERVPGHDSIIRTRDSRPSEDRQIGRSAPSRPWALPVAVAKMPMCARIIS